MMPVPTMAFLPGSLLGPQACHLSFLTHRRVHFSCQTAPLASCNFLEAHGVSLTVGVPGQTRPFPSSNGVMGLMHPLPLKVTEGKIFV